MQQIKTPKQSLNDGLVNTNSLESNNSNSASSSVVQGTSAMNSGSFMLKVHGTTSESMKEHQAQAKPKINKSDFIALSGIDNFLDSKY